AAAGGAGGADVMATRPVVNVHFIQGPPHTRRAAFRGSSVERQGKSMRSGESLPVNPRRDGCVHLLPLAWIHSAIHFTIVSCGPAGGTCSGQLSYPCRYCRAVQPRRPLLLSLIL